MPSITDIIKYRKTGICPCCGFRSPSIGIELPPESLLRKLIKESKRVGKAVWTCSGSTQFYLNDVMRTIGITDQETMEETIARRKEEEKHGK